MRRFFKKPTNQSVLFRPFAWEILLRARGGECCTFGTLAGFSGVSSEGSRFTWEFELLRSISGFSRPRIVSCLLHLTLSLILYNIFHNSSIFYLQFFQFCGCEQNFCPYRIKYIKMLLKQSRIVWCMWSDSLKTVWSYLKKQAAHA